MSEKLPEWTRKVIWQLSCSIGEWSGDEAASDEDPLPWVTKIVKRLAEEFELCPEPAIYENLSAEDLLPIYKLMVASMLYASEIELHKRENWYLMEKFEKQRDAVAKAFPFTDEEQERWR